MSFASWLTIAFVFLIIISIAIGIGWWIRNNSNPPPAPPNKFSAPLVWGKPFPGPNPAKNFCQLYQFPTSEVVIDNVKTVVPGNPTFNPLILDDLNGVVEYPLCLDPDQIMAQQLQHTCTAPIAVVDGAITRCFLLEGGTTGLGGNESFYTNSGCPNLPPCAGQLSLVSLNFQVPLNPDIFCLQSNGTGNNISINPCDPTKPNQLFRVTRVNPGQNPNSLKPGQGQNGIIAQILDRNSGLCVVPGNSAATTIFNPAYLGTSGCSGPETPISGQNIILSACTGGPFPGYVWALLPSVIYCSIPGGCTSCTGCAGCTQIQGSNFCAGCAGCTGSNNLITPPQIINIADLDLSTFPTGMTAYFGLTGSSAIVQWLIDNDANLLLWGGAGNTPIIATGIGLDRTRCGDKAFNAQYINLTVYNTIIEESVCFADGTLGTPSCTAL